MSMKLYNGDCLEVMPTLADNSVDLTSDTHTTVCKYSIIHSVVK